MRLSCKAFTLSCLLFALNHPAVYAEDFYDDRERGWFWYETIPIEEPEQEKKEPEPVPSPTLTLPPQLSPRERLKQQGEALENAMATAILYPTPENYRQYLEQSKQIQEQSQLFALGLKQAIWLNPEYDYTLESPNNAQAIIAKNEQINLADDAAIAALADKTGLLFFFRSDCPYCHRFAPILKKFSEHYEFPVIPISLDGPGLKEFPYPKTNLELAQLLKVDVVPAVALLEPKTQKVSMVSYGFNDWGTLIKKMLFAGDLLMGDASQ